MSQVSGVIPSSSITTASTASDTLEKCKIACTAAGVACSAYDFKASASANARCQLFDTRLVANKISSGSSVVADGNCYVIPKAPDLTNGPCVYTNQLANIPNALKYTPGTVTD